MITTSPRYTRRTFLRALAYAAFGAALAGSTALLYSTQIEPNWLAIERLALKLPRLPRSFEGYTVVQLSDLHLGPFIGAKELRHVVEATNALQPDVIVATGDFVSRLSRGEADTLKTELAYLAARDGVYAVLGNHDWWTNHRVVEQALQQAGLTVLRNQNTALTRNGETFYLAGVDDVWEQQADLVTALEGIPQSASVILLAHEPDYADTAATDPRVSLQLSGHSHGGQVYIPGLPLWVPRYAHKYPVGLRQIENLQLYTNRGIGLTGLPIRFNCRPEITLFTLTA